ncbi:hypothetical protein ACKWTF_015804 [Chironomus riparius]
MNFCHCMTFAITLAIFIQNFTVIQAKSEDKFSFNGVRFKSVKCQSDNTTITTKYCYLKAVSRKDVTLNIGVKFLVPHTRPFFIQFIFHYRYGTIFRQIIDTKKLEICAILDGTDTNLLVKLVHDLIKNRLPELVHKCPYKDDWDFKNFTLNMDLVDKATMLFSEGTYRVDVSVYFSDVNTINVSIVIDIKSTIKESFG